jgi:outer membrane protein OmpA-like peptidoglycan-associated protein
MKLVQITGITGAALTALAVAACGANSGFTAAQQRAEQRAEEARQEAREARADAEKARLQAAEAQAWAEQAIEATREADRQPLVASQRAAQAERQVNRDAHRETAPRTGVAEPQPQGAVLFASDSADLTTSARAQLDDVARSILARGPDRGVIVDGYADDRGTDSANAYLSQRRADAVANYLVNRGVPGRNIITRGLGSRTAASTNDTDRGKPLNRSAEILVKP